MSLLELTDVNSYYDTSHVLHDVSLSVDDAQLVTLVGRNGAGKTTTLRSIMGIVNPRSGVITFRDEEIQSLSSTEVSRRGIALIPEHRRVFPELTVRENLRLGYLGHDENDNMDDRLATNYEYFPRLEEREDQKAGQMSGGEQQMLAIARALMSGPDLLLIDEPTEGLMPPLVEKLRDLLVEINDEGMTILLVEQNVELALDISDYAYVIDEGVIQSHAPSEEIRTDEEIKQKYLAV